MRRGIIVSALALSALIWFASGSLTAQRGAVSPATAGGADAGSQDPDDGAPVRDGRRHAPADPRSRGVRITDHGARGDGATLNTAAIAAAIAACAKAGGGRWSCPAACS